MNAFDAPLGEYRLRAVRIGVQASLLALAAVVLYLALPGHGTVRMGPMVLVIALAVATVIAIAVVPWARVRAPRAIATWMYTWAVADTVLISLGVAFTGGTRSELFVLYFLTTVFVASAYPRPGQAGLLCLTLVCYAAAVGPEGWSVAPAGMFLRLSSLAIVAFLGSFISNELMAQALTNARARMESDRRAALLRTVAAATNSMTSLRREQVVTVLMDALLELGFDSAALAIYDEGGGWHLEQRRNLPSDLGLGTLREGLAEVMAEHDRTFAVEDYPAQPWALPGFVDYGVKSLVATPVHSGGHLVAALVASTQTARSFTGEDVECVELLSAHAGVALQNAGDFEREREAVERMAELDGLKQDFLSTVSHELRTPLTVILGNGQTLATRWPTLDEDLRLELIQRLNANAQALDTIIADLLDFSRLEAGALEAHTHPFDLDRVLRHAATRLSSLFARHQLSVDVEPELVVMADASLIDRVVENLLSNASKHTRPGTEVRLEARTEADMARVSVIDHGPGISPEDLRHLGERFFRGGDPNTRTTRGTGLGLALAKEVLRLHGTDLDVRSEIGRGSRFSFVLPLAPPLQVEGSRLVRNSGPAAA
jgi:two-component system sensor histidine kinase KdpD